MANYQRGDTVLVWHVWPEPDGRVGKKRRPGIIYDIIAEDHYCILIFGTDRTGKIPGFKVEQKSSEGRKMKIDKDSFINLSKIVPLKRVDIIKQIGFCPEEILNKIEEVIDEFGIERP